MKRLFLAALMGLVLIWGGFAQGGDGKGTEVTLDGMKSTTPATWKMQKPASKLRAYQFQLPRAKGDTQDAELAVFFFGPGGGGSVADNIKRWKGLFQPPKDKSIDDVSRVDTYKFGNVEITYLDIHGTYMFRPPFDPNAKAKPMAGFRRFGVIFESDNGPYFLTVTGPANTLAKHKEDFDAWLYGFIRKQTMDDYFVLADRAFKERKPLVVWVGVRRPALEKDLGDCLHCWLDSFPQVKKTAIVVGVPNPRWLTRHDFSANATTGQIRGILTPKKKSPGQSKKAEQILQAVVTEVLTNPDWEETRESLIGPTDKNMARRFVLKDGYEAPWPAWFEPKVPGYKRVVETPNKPVPNPYEVLTLQLVDSLVLATGNCIKADYQIVVIVWLENYAIYRHPGHPGRWFSRPIICNLKRQGKTWSVELIDGLGGRTKRIDM